MPEVARTTSAVLSFVQSVVLKEIDGAKTDFSKYLPFEKVTSLKDVKDRFVDGILLAHFVNSIKRFSHSRNEAAENNASSAAKHSNSSSTGAKLKEIATHPSHALTIEAGIDILKMDTSKGRENLISSLDVAKAKLGLNISTEAINSFADCFTTESASEQLWNSSLYCLVDLTKLSISGFVSLGNHYELIRLLEKNEPLADLLKVSSSQLLLRWVNYHLKRADFPFTVKDWDGKFVQTSLSEGNSPSLPALASAENIWTCPELHFQLFHQIAPKFFSKEALEQQLPSKTEKESDLASIKSHLTKAITVAETSLQVHQNFISSSTDLESNDEFLVFGYIASLFQRHMGIRLPTEEEIAVLFDRMALLKSSVTDSDAKIVELENRRKELLTLQDKAKREEEIESEKIQSAVDKELATYSVSFEESSKIKEAKLAEMRALIEKIGKVSTTFGGKDAGPSNSNGALDHQVELQKLKSLANMLISSNSDLRKKQAQVKAESDKNELILSKVVPLAEERANIKTDKKGRPKTPDEMKTKK